MADIAFVYNHDVSGLQRRINRFIEEAVHSASNGTSQVTIADQIRLMSYLAAVKDYVAWVVGQPQLDLPETHPRQYPLEANPVVPDVENESIVDLIHHLELARDETTNGQSGRMPSGLIKFDEVRLLAVISKAERFLVEYVQKVTPLDLPESSPMRAIADPGRTGV